MRTYFHSLSSWFLFSWSDGLLRLKTNRKNLFLNLDELMREPTESQHEDSLDSSLASEGICLFVDLWLERHRPRVIVASITGTKIQTHNRFKRKLIL